MSTVDNVIEVCKEDIVISFSFLDGAFAAGMKLSDTATCLREHKVFDKPTADLLFKHWLKARDKDPEGKLRTLRKRVDLSCTRLRKSEGWARKEIRRGDK